MPNNYDTNSNGPNIEAYACHDVGIAQDMFDQNFERVPGFDAIGRINNSDDIYFYTNYHQYDPGLLYDFDLSEYNDPEYEPELDRMIKDMGYDPAEFDDLSEKVEMIDEFRRGAGDYDYGFNFDDNNDQSVRHYMDREYGLFPRYKDKDGNYFNDYPHVDITGYREYARVYYPPGKFENKKKAKEYFSNLFYQQPISARAVIDGSEYYYHEYLEQTDKDINEYDMFERDGWIKWLADQSGVDKSEIDAVVPAEPKHY